MKARLFWLCALMLVSCGDPLQQGDYQGEPLFELNGLIYLNQGGDTDANARIALLWLGDRQRGLFDYGVARSSFPSRYELTIFNPPYERAMRRVPNSDVRFAVARIVLYDDTNQNGRIDLDENLIGGSNDRLVAYFSGEGVSEVVGGSFRQGYQILGIAGTCDAVQEAGGAQISAREGRAVNLTVTMDVATTIPDLDCTDLPNDYCLELRSQIENGEEGLIDHYLQECEEGAPNPNNQAWDPDGNDVACADFPDENPDPDLADICRDERVSQCQELLYDYEIDNQQPDALLAFGDCMGGLDVCRELYLMMSEDPNSPDEYRECIVAEYGLHHILESPNNLNPNNEIPDNLNSANMDDPSLLSCQELEAVLNDQNMPDIELYQAEYEQRCQ